MSYEKTKRSFDVYFAAFEETIEKVATVETTFPKLADALQQAYVATQNINELWILGSTVKSVVECDGLRSLSVGDYLLTYDVMEQADVGACWEVDSFGFKERPAQILQMPKADIAAYLKANPKPGGFAIGAGELP